jgi:4-amino-4-deoxy-L-arabinose transferase-like glycosyltransferase
LVLYLVLALAYWLVTPVYEGPDEPMHYAYVRHLVETRRLPPLTDYGGSHPAHQETSQPPLYYIVAALLTFWTPDQGDYAVLLERNPHFAYPAPPTVPDNKNTWLHTPVESFPWHGTILAIRLTRLVSLLFGALGVLATWGLARELWPSSDWRPLLAAGVIAFIPQFLFMSSVVTNDTAATALSACVLWVAARTAHRPANARRLLLLGLLLGLAALTKLSALGLVPLVCLLLVTGAWRRKLSRPVMLRGLGLMLGMTVLVAGWWYARNWFLYDNPFSTQVHLTSPWAWGRPSPLQAALAQLGGVERSFWGVFGTGNVGLPDEIYMALRASWLLALAGWGLVLLRRPPQGTIAWVWGGLWGWYLLVLALQVRWMQLVLAPWGRLLFPALAAMACLLVEGWWGWLPIRARPALLLAPVAGFVILSTVVPLATIRPAYARPAQLTPAQVTARACPTDFRLGNLARLIGYDLDRTSLPPGGWLTVTLCWEVIKPTTNDYTLFVQLIGVDGGLVASRHTYPGQGRFPTSQWRPGDRFCDETRAYVNERAPVPAIYQVEVGLLETASDVRLPVYTADGLLGGPLFLTPVRIAPEILPEVVVPVPLDYRLGEALALVGQAALPETIRAGYPLSLTMYWRATASPPADYTAFVHLIDPAGEVVAQVDRPPRDGRYPTSFWVPGEVISDTFTLPVPATVTPGQYRLVGGMYTWPDLARLPVVGPDGTPQPESLVELGNVTVR